MSFSYQGQIIFDDFSLDASSDIVGLSGPPGCGKTTLLKILAGVLKPKSISVFNVPQDALLILQEDALLPWLTGWQNLTIAGLRSKKAIADHPLYSVVEPLLEKHAHAMSFGQRRTVELFRAFAFQPRFLCLDEPFNFIDEITRSVYLEFLQRKPFPGVVVMSTHHVSELARINAEVFRFSGALPVSSLEVAR